MESELGVWWSFMKVEPDKVTTFAKVCVKEGAKLSEIRFSLRRRTFLKAFQRYLSQIARCMDGPV